MYKQRYLLLMSVPFVVWLIVFKYVPLWVDNGISGCQAENICTVRLGEGVCRPWVILQRLYGQTVQADDAQYDWNQYARILLGTVMAIVFALMLNEIRFVKFKKATQTISYLPHFVSWVVIASIAKMVLNDGGMLDTLLNTKLKLMSTNSPLFWVVVCMINVWKEMGWDAISVSVCDGGNRSGLYEAAKGRRRRTAETDPAYHTPGIKPTVIVLLIMSVGSTLNVAMERQMLLSNGIVQDHAMVLSWFSLPERYRQTTITV